MCREVMMRIWKCSFPSMIEVFVCVVAILAATCPLSAAEPQLRNKGEVLLGASFSGNVEKIKQLLDEGADVNYATSLGITPLLEACTHNRPAAVKILLERGANPNLASKLGMTPLAGAVVLGDLESTRILLDHGADVNATVRLTVPGQQSNELTVVRMVAQKGDLPLLELLIQKGANVNHRDRHGQTPLMAAIWTGKLDVVKLLLEKGAEVNVKDNYGQTPLGLANHADHKEMRELLVRHGAKE